MQVNGMQYRVKSQMVAFRIATTSLEQIRRTAEAAGHKTVSEVMRDLVYVAFPPVPPSGEGAEGCEGQDQGGDDHV